MKKSLLKIAKVVSISALLLGSTSTINAQNSEGTLNPLAEFLASIGIEFTFDGNEIVIVEEGNTGFQAPSIPLDGELGLLLLGATAFGVNKLRKKNAKA